MTSPPRVRSTFSNNAAPPPTVDVTVGTRFGADSLHFGLAGRISWTAVLVAIPIAGYRWGGFPYGLGFAGLWSIALLPRALRQLWSTSERRIRVTKLR